MTVNEFINAMTAKMKCSNCGAEMSNLKMTYGRKELWFAPSFMLLILLLLIITLRFEGDATKDLVISEVQKRTNGRSLEIVGLITNRGKHTFSSVTIEAEFFDAAGNFLDQRSQRGEKLTAEDQIYLDRAKVIRSQGKGPSGNRPGVSQRQAPAQMIPLSDMSAEDRYEGQDGGLYGGGRNTPDDKLQQIAEAQLAKIQPLDADGKPAADGKIAFISISMSNATQEFSRFKQIADQSAEKSATVTVVDCAQGGQAMAEWVPADGGPWRVAMERLLLAGIWPNQVQVAWVKLANKGPSGTFAEHSKKLESDTIQVLKNARNKFPNLQIAYLGSRIWAGHAKGNLNPEPYAYESGFVARELIRRQASGDASLDLETSPLLLWGPYLWAEGAKGRKLDGLTWEPADFTGDGVHPSPSGRDKVAQLLLKFVTTDPLAKPWFVR